MFSSGAVTTCFYDLGLSRIGLEHLSFRLLGERYYRLRLRRGSTLLARLLVVINQRNNFIAYRKMILLMLNHFWRLLYILIAFSKPKNFNLNFRSTIIFHRLFPHTTLYLQEIYIFYLSEGFIKSSSDQNCLMKHYPCDITYNKLITRTIYITRMRLLSVFYTLSSEFLWYWAL